MEQQNILGADQRDTHFLCIEPFGLGTAMESNQRDNFFLPFSGLLLMAALAIGLIWVDQPLQSNRPQERQTFVQDSFDNEDVPARLWQDPFEPVFLARASADDEQDLLAERHELLSVAREIQFRAHTTPQPIEQLVILPVMVPGSGFAEDGESRRRMRQATIAALAVRGYAAQSGERIGYFETKWQSPSRRIIVGSNVPYHLSIPIPFEWFRKKSLKPATSESASNIDPEWVLLMWLDEGAFDRHTLVMLNDLLGHLVGDHRVENVVENQGNEKDSAGSDILSRIQLRMIGPASSTTMPSIMDKGQIPILSYRPSLPLTKQVDESLQTLAQLFNTPPIPTRVPRLDQLPSVLFEPFPNHFIQHLKDRFPEDPSHPDSGFQDVVDLLVDPALLRDHLAGASDLLDKEGGFKIWFRRLADDLRAAVKAGLAGRSHRSGAWADQVAADWAREIGSRLPGKGKSPLKPIPNVLPHLQIFSSRSTASQFALRLEDADWNMKMLNHDDSVESIIFQRFGVKFVSTTPRDDQVARVVVEELKRRGVDVLKGQRLVLIGEWDTFYGRSMDLAFRDAIMRHSPEDVDQPPDDAGGLPWHRRQVIRFSYLRGLDGATPQNQPRSNTRDSSDKESQKPWEFNYEDWERPFGPSGLDYMRRLADELSQLENYLAKEEKSIGAIGVVGSDVYDKLLVLQALRRRFPSVIFFTIDLDARMLHPTQYNWCRNLVVASGFGLELERVLQHGIPPFRDNYQTSTFLAAQLALGRSEIEEKDFVAKWKVSENRGEIGAYLKPLIFEVARSGAYDITPDNQRSDIHPDPNDSRRNQSPEERSRTAVLVVVLLIILHLQLYLLSDTYRKLTLQRYRLSSRDRESSRNVCLLGLVLVVSLAVCIYQSAQGGGGEPLEFFEGISIWPTEILRCVVVVLCGAFIAVAVSTIKASDRMLEREDFMTSRHHARRPPAFFKHWGDTRKRTRNWVGFGSRRRRRWFWSRWFRRVLLEWTCFRIAVSRVTISGWLQLIRKQQQERQRLDVGKLWLRYTNLGRIRHRFLRVLPLVVLYFCLRWMITYCIGGRFVPYRGDIAMYVDWVVIFASEFSLLLLTFFVVDATRLCEAFVCALSDRPTAWPPTDLIQQTAKERGVKPADLGDFIDIQVICRRTEVIGKLIVYPFIVLLVGMVSLNGYFDNWQWSPAAMLFFGFILAYAIFCAVVLRRAAERARGKAIARLEHDLSAAYISRAKKDQGKVDQIQLMITEIRELKRGAFAPFFQHPIVRAIVIPFGGVGTVALLDVLIAMGT